MGRENEEVRNSADKLNILLGLYEDPYIVGYESLMPKAAPRKLPYVGWSFSVYPKPDMIYQSAVGISERSFGTQPDISAQIFDQLLPEHIYRSRLRSIIQKIIGQPIQGERPIQLARILEAGKAIHQLDRDLPLGFYLLGADPDTEEHIEDFIVAPSVEFTDIALVMSDRLAHVTALNN